MRTTPSISGLRAARSWFRDGSIPRATKLLALFAILYVVSPIDLIPDVPFLGWLDDLGVLAFAAHHLLKSIKNHTPKPATVVVEAQPVRNR